MLRKIIGSIEISIIIASAYFGYQWTENPEGNYEPWLFLAGLVLITLDVFRRYEIRLVKREGRKFTPGELIKHSDELKKQFQDEIYKCRSQELRKDVIIRHVNRMDSYPEIVDTTKGVSSWFRVGLLDTYHRGIMVGLGYGTLSNGPEGLRYTDYQNGEHGDIKVLLIGKIPYEYIEGVHFDGDEYYNFPHIFCHYAKNGEPYEELVYCQEIDMGNGHTYYKEVAKHEEVKQNSTSWGGKYFA